MNEIERRTGNRRELTALESGLAARVVELEAVLRDAHSAIDQLFAMLIVETRFPREEVKPFMPSKSVMWPTMLRISAELAKYQPTEKP